MERLQILDRLQKHAEAILYQRKSGVDLAFYLQDEAGPLVFATAEGYFSSLDENGFDGSFNDCVLALHVLRDVRRLCRRLGLPCLEFTPTKELRAE
ncbi:hypothetical protein BN874_840016 [Candidatus Contendobacter odensis Run_B_J11]|uniref:Uncharacterized protein n=2 Tax=Candidatus Contendibacter odensensis TaxID=1400860 RepID=A0A7U7GGA4_9GAMM|nr:hypothetical protein BN874_840016 [Candidatus Contendobacter odensis Run_B_J11]